jgi:hypothetical protein
MRARNVSALLEKFIWDLQDITAEGTFDYHGHSIPQVEKLFRSLNRPGRARSGLRSAFRWVEVALWQQVAAVAHQKQAGISAPSAIVPLRSHVCTPGFVTEMAKVSALDCS